MTDSSNEMNPTPMPSNGETVQPAGPSTAGARPTQPGPDDAEQNATDAVDAQAPGLYVDQDTGPVPEPNEPG